MTPRQLELLDFIKAYTSENRMAPTYREMQEHMGYKTPANVFVMVNRLIEQGDLTAVRGRARSVKVVGTK